MQKGERNVERRLLRLRRLMEERDIEALLISHPINRRYLTGFTGSSGWVVVTRREQILITDFRYRGQVKDQAPNFEFVEHAGNPFIDIKKIMIRCGIDSIAFEENHLTFSQYRKLTESLEGLKTVPSSDLVERLRLIKDEEEVQRIRDAVAISDGAFEKILEEIRPGMTERDISLRLEFLMREAGAESSSFDMIIASGPRSALPHGVASDRVLATGDLVTMDFGAYYQGYCSDMTRTVMIGSPSDQQREIYGIVLEAQKRAIQAIKAGISGREVDAKARDYIRDRGYGEAFGHSTGHGLGMELHEGPTLSYKNERELEPGMIVTVEPGIYLPDVGGVRIEDNVLVTDEGHEVLTRSPKELIQID
ncbi:M24 family metallopeptidase [Kroppenstedtia guangzhouensis]|uniref:M24 family metallopeptidase n=1 Tax=Kroppenstedtia guangzhouensis TaxID=1274356 RepID=UPI00166D580F